MKDFEKDGLTFQRNPGSRRQKKRGQDRDGLRDVVSALKNLEVFERP